MTTRVPATLCRDPPRQLTASRGPRACGRESARGFPAVFTRVLMQMEFGTQFLAAPVSHSLMSVQTCPGRTKRTSPAFLSRYHSRLRNQGITRYRSKAPDAIYWDPQL